MSISFFAASYTTSIVYAAPVVVLAFVYWALSKRAQTQVKRASKIPTEVDTTRALAEYFKTRELTDVSVVKGEDYLKNEYDATAKAVKLSPDVFGCVDLGSLAYALHVGAEAESARRAPGELPTSAKLGSIATVIFWCVFGVLGAGVMTGNLPSTLIGYVLFAVMAAVNAKKQSIMKRIDDDARHFVTTSKLFDAATAEQLAKTIDAIRKVGE